MEEILEKVGKLLINKNHEENEIAELRHDLTNLYDIVTHVKRTGCYKGGSFHINGEYFPLRIEKVEDVVKLFRSYMEKRIEEHEEQLKNVNEELKKYIKIGDNKND